MSERAGTPRLRPAPARPPPPLGPGPAPPRAGADRSTSAPGWRRWRDRATRGCLGRRIARDALDPWQRAQDDVAGEPQIVIVADAHIVLAAPLRMSRPHGHGTRVDVAVGDDDALAVIGAQDRGAGLDRLDGALEGSGYDLVARTERPAVEDEQAREPVLQDVLEGEADGDRADPEGREQVGRLHRREYDGRDHQQTQQQQDPTHEPAQEQSEVRGAAPLEPGHHRAPAQGRHPDEQQEHAGRDGEIGQQPEEPGHEPLQFLDRRRDLLGHHERLAKRKGQGESAEVPIRPAVAR